MCALPCCLLGGDNDNDSRQKPRTRGASSFCRPSSIGQSVVAASIPPNQPSSAIGSSTTGHRSSSAPPSTAIHVAYTTCRQSVSSQQPVTPSTTLRKGQQRHICCRPFLFSFRSFSPDSFPSKRREHPRTIWHRRSPSAVPPHPKQGKHQQRTNTTNPTRVVVVVRNGNSCSFPPKTRLTRTPQNRAKFNETEFN